MRAPAQAEEKAPEKNCGCACCTGKDVCCCHEESAKEQPAQGHPLRGKIIDVLSAKSALLIKHEEIPGFMPAMTMLFKVDVATLKMAVKGHSITGRLVQRGEDYWLDEMRIIP